MKSVFTRSNHYIRRRIMQWDPTKKAHIAFVGPSPAPACLFSTSPTGVYPTDAIHNTLGGAMTHIGDGWWERKILGSDMQANLGINTNAYEIVHIDTFQHHDSQEVKFYSQRSPDVA